MTAPNTSPQPRRWKRGDIHPETGMVFWKYDPASRGGEYWITPGRLAEVRAMKRRSDAAWQRTDAGHAAAREAKRKQRTTADGREKDRDAKRKWSRSEKGRASFARWYERAMSDPDYRERRRAAVRAAKAANRLTPSGRMADRLRARILDCFDRIGAGKPASTAELLGCGWQTARGWIERQFIDGMSWDNMGEWHIDHIVPLCMAGDDLAELRALCHYTNLRPLAESANLRRRRDGSDLSSAWPRAKCPH